MGAYISFNSQIGGKALIGAWALKGMNTVFFNASKFYNVFKF